MKIVYTLIVGLTNFGPMNLSGYYPFLFSEDRKMLHKFFNIFQILASERMRVADRNINRKSFFCNKINIYKRFDNFSFSPRAM